VSCWIGGESWLQPGTAGHKSMKLLDVLVIYAGYGEQLSFSLRKRSRIVKLSAAYVSIKLLMKTCQNVEQSPL
jgi:hypothetical protein